ncbi:hypothetical protein OH77DRAFT_1410382 [Trametes cingulata]|nr:hypothetical protein OH77DRAFT_1410382 [Trametes cingulata]
MPIVTLSHALRAVATASFACHQCCPNVSVSVKFCYTSSVLFFELQPGTNVSIDHKLVLENVDGSLQRWLLRGVVYLGANHFTARYISSSGMVWYHDGAATGSICTPQGSATSLDLHSAFGRSACHLLYFKELM